ncbi:ABC transporter permease [Paenibacillus medicaginis]|uniref:Transport permease protein n=1 Tax=Paenibacillus medicaginis TaxID=1470560 RepID=A0ABV5C8H4_9BACL
MFGTAFLKDLIAHRRLIIQLSLKDLKDKYLGSYLGILWAIIQPAITILIFWFIFQVGFKSLPIENYPFILWLVAGMIPWFFFADALMNATNSIVGNIFLVKNVVFRVSLLPIVKIISPLIIHLFFVIVMVVMFWSYGFPPNIYFLQIFYYLFAMSVFILAISWITSALVIFLKDVGQILAMFLQFGYWITPILWSLNMIPSKYEMLIKLNPMYYIIEGYRYSLIFRSWFWQYPRMTLYFWGVTICLLLLGAFVFKRLRPHFADVL